nr:hypothetical protein Iba_chr09aCG4020 [Ipomoea batatas]GMD33542.1 hypothetical protein Iba_chr09cCG3580 [Ipomoea batatas]GMD35269.1 hypothetical protein Iba_chr09dCG5360 [Ipomoea batatas]GMD36956.1 hypothetical protein Iba_chr09eCG4800 [Ipomoea batatas]GMD38506.1 hypothetical protein Iba_chr09fCG4610 [Ipomoea batatas]
MSILKALFSCFVHQTLTLQSSLPDTSIEGSVREKSTLHARFSCSSYSITLCLVVTSQTVTIPS